MGLIMETWNRLFLCDGRACPDCTEQNREYCNYTSKSYHAIAEVEIPEVEANFKLPIWWTNANLWQIGFSD